MSTVQLAIGNRRYATALAELLQRDGSHRVVFADAPDLAVEGVLVVDGNKTENLLLFEEHPERFVVITRKDAGLMARIWDAGVRHVAFEEDSPSLAMLAVIAAELRDSSTAKKRPPPKFPVPILDTNVARYRICRCTSRFFPL